MTGTMVRSDFTGMMRLRIPPHCVQSEANDALQRTPVIVSYEVRVLYRADVSSEAIRGLHRRSYHVGLLSFELDHASTWSMFSFIQHS